MGFLRGMKEWIQREPEGLPTGWYTPGILDPEVVDILYPDGPLPPIDWQGGDINEAAKLLEQHLQETRAEIAQANDSVES